MNRIDAIRLDMNSIVDQERLEFLMDQINENHALRIVLDVGTPLEERQKQMRKRLYQPPTLRWWQNSLEEVTK